MLDGAAISAPLEPILGNTFKADFEENCIKNITNMNYFLLTQLYCMKILSSSYIIHWFI